MRRWIGDGHLRVGCRPLLLWVLAGLLSAGAARAGGDPPPGRPLVGDAFYPPLSAAKDAGESWDGPMGAGFWDGSEFLVGDVGVVVILVESDGTIDPSRENWTAEEEEWVTAQVGEAMEWWRRRLSPDLLSFTLEFQYRVLVPYEPITRPQPEEALWIESALDALHQADHDRFTGTQRLVNDFRERGGLDWAFALYVVDSSEDEDGMFPDGHFAYSYVGGPFAVLTLDNDGWGMENFASVCAHEMGHIFYALDQYYAAHVPCDRPSGYLCRETENSQYGDCPEEVPNCIMRSCRLVSATLSSTARGQVGWGDEDGDSIPDVLDTAPSVRFSGRAAEDGLHYGVARATALPNRNPSGYGHAITINRIERVAYRWDGGPWIDAEPSDGEWGGQSEEFRLSLLAAAGSAGKVQIRAWNQVGNRTDPPFSLDISLPAGSGAMEGKAHSPSPVRLLGNRPNPFNPATEIRLGADAATPGVLGRVYDARGSLVRLLWSGDLPAGETVLLWDGRDEAGRAVASGRYFFRLTAPGMSEVTPLTLVR